MATSVPTLGSIGDRVDLRIRQGATFGPHRITFTNPDGTPMDLTGCELRAQLRRQALDVDVLATFDCLIDTPVITDPETESQAQFGQDAETTAAIECGEDSSDPLSTAVWDMELVDAAGRVTPVFYGAVSIFREVTRA